MPETSTAAHALVQPLPDARAYGSVVTLAQCQVGGAALSEFFNTPIGYGWRPHFVEPTLHDLRGLGPTLLPFDF